jgi:hypothetical protein
MNLKTRFIKSIVGIALIGTLATPFLLASCNKANNEKNKEGEKEKDFADEIIQAYEEIITYLQDNAVPEAPGDDVDFSSSTKNEAMLKYFDDNFNERLLFNSLIFEFSKLMKTFVDIVKNNYILEYGTESAKIKFNNFNLIHTNDSFIAVLDVSNTNNETGETMRFRESYTRILSGTTARSINKYEDETVSIFTTEKTTDGILANPSADTLPVDMKCYDVTTDGLDNPTRKII